jgi:hypothetical protein
MNFLTFSFVSDLIFWRNMSWRRRKLLITWLQFNQCEDKVLDVKNLLADLMREYHEEEDVGNKNNDSAAPSDDNCHDFLSSLSARVAGRMPASMSFKSELDRYLDEEALDMHTPNFKVLDWWKVAGTRFPTLRRIARDIFAIPVTTVALE